MALVRRRFVCDHRRTDEPGGLMAMSEPSVAPVPPPEPQRGSNGAVVGGVVLIVLGALIALSGLAVTAGGGLLTWAHATQRDANGFYMTPTERFETTTYAITSDALDLGRSGDDTPFDLGDLATLRLRVEGTGRQPVFVGIASQRDVDAYLASVSHAQIDNIRTNPFSVDYRYQDGPDRPSPPGRGDIWVASASGPGQQSLEWAPTSGRWVAVVMNADGSSGVSVDVSAGARVPWLGGLGIGLLVGGLVGVAIGGILLVVGVVLLARHQHIDLGGPAAEAGRPVRLEGRLEEPLSRWLWLVKWVLLIPHFVVLIALWLAFSVVTVVAFFAILFTGRYPRSLFEFNVGVLRWTWRVTYYGYSALGTDRYPPFTLGHTPDYPATLEVAYPERLSRGLVLVKWWLLAIPQYMVLAVIWGGGWAASGTRGGVAASLGLVGLLVLFAAVALLFTGRYPKGMFDFVVGLNRWGFRVVAYVALMRDEYPPFRLDQGATEPAAPMPPPPPSAGGTEASAATAAATEA
jgi:hypothetical protein